MALIVEDGTGSVLEADAYDTAANVIAYAAKRGVTVEPATAETLIYKAMDYLATFETQWAGYRTFALQPLAFPRYGIFHNGRYFDRAAIPTLLKAALAQLVIYQTQGLNLTPSSSAQEAFVTKEKVDVIETTYSEAVRIAQLNSGVSLPDMPLVAALLAPLLDGGGFTLRTRRV